MSEREPFDDHGVNSRGEATRFRQGAGMLIVAALLVAALVQCARDPDGAQQPAATEAGQLPKVALFTYGPVAVSGEDVWVATIDPQASPGALESAARSWCGDRDFCKVVGWFDREKTAKGFPFTEREAGAIAFNLTVNRQSGMDEAVWDCANWPKDRPGCPAS